jgi:hypothetical protein
MQSGLLIRASVSTYPVICALSLCLCLTACDPPPNTFPMVIKVQDDESSPVAGVPVEISNQAVGVTDSNGILGINLTGEEGDAHTITVRCPAGYRTVNETRSVVLPSPSELEATKALEFDWQCLPRERVAALVVRARGQSGLPVYLSGKEVARTNSDGIAHALFRLAPGPGSNLHVALDTSARPELSPRSPEPDTPTRSPSTPTRSPGTPRDRGT